MLNFASERTRVVGGHDSYRVSGLGGVSHTAKVEMQCLLLT